MQRIGVRELRQDASRYLREVKAGRRVEVTERGRLVALLVPPTASATVREELVATGRLLPADRPRGRFRPAPKPAGAPSTEGVLDDLRDDRG